MKESLSKASKSQRTHEKFVILLIIGIFASVVLMMTVFTNLYYYFTMNGAYSFENVLRPNLSIAVFSSIFSLGGMQLVVGTQVFVTIITSGSSTPLYPGIVFYSLAWVSIPFMIRLTGGIPKLRRILYIHLVCTQLSSPILGYWTGFGA